MAEKVIVVLTDEEVSWLAEQDTSRGPLRVKLRAALGRDREASDRALAEMYAEVRKEPKEGTISEAIKCHSQACGLVAYAFDVHPDSVALAIERADQVEGNDE